MLAQYTAEFVRNCTRKASVLMAGKEGSGRRSPARTGVAHRHGRLGRGGHHALELRAHPDVTAIQQSDYITEVIHEIEMAVRAEKSGDRSNRIIKQLEAHEEELEGPPRAAGRPTRKKDDLLTWEQLGIDGLFVDEAHLFKNLYRFTKMTWVAGLPLTSSERAFDLFLKTRYTMQLHGHAQRGSGFATATPVANTMAEIHTMMRYLQPNRLAELGLQQFDAWAATFGESVTALEIAPDAAAIGCTRASRASSTCPS